MKELGYVHPISIWDENSIRCCHLESHLFLMCCMDGLAFPSEDILLFNMILYSLCLFTYVDKLPWNWISDFGAPLVPLQHADTNGNPIFIGIAGFSIRTIYKYSTHGLFLQPRRTLPGFPFPK